MLRYEVDVDAQAPRRYCALVGPAWTSVISGKRGGLGYLNTF